MFLVSLEQIVPWMFAFDHTHYARWMSIFINDLKLLPSRHSTIYEEFCKGDFTVQKSRKLFSSMAEDQAHEQNNKLVKIDGGAIGILDNQKALMKWMVAEPQIVEMLESFDDEGEGDDSDFNHHEDTDTFELHYRKDAVSLKK